MPPRRYKVITVPETLYEELKKIKEKERKRSLAEVILMLIESRGARVRSKGVGR